MLANQFWSQLISNSCFSNFSVVFFYFLTIFFDFEPILSATPKGWKESIGFPDPEFHAESFEKKPLKKKSNIQEACQILKIIGEAISSHIISSDFQTLQNNPELSDSKQKY